MRLLHHDDDDKEFCSWIRTLYDSGMSIPFLAEARGAVRLARRQLLFTTLLVTVLALGIGSSIAMFSILNAVALRPLPYGSPRQLVWLWSIRPDGTRGPFSMQDVADLRERTFGSAGIAAFANWNANLTGVGTPERLQGMRVSANAFSVLQIDAAVGRTFRPEDGADGRVVVLGHGLWSRRFGADRSVVGRTLALNGANYTVAGVLPASFVFPIRDAEIAVPLVEAEVRRTEGDVNFLRLIVRLQPGVTLGRAEQALTTIAGELRRVRPQNTRKAAIRVTPLHEQIVGDYASTLRLLLGAVLLVLLLACVNLASLSLARTATRQRELAVRAALGVSRSRLMAQLLLETMVPVSVAGGLGLLLAAWESHLIVAVAPVGMPRTTDVSLDPRVVAFALGATLVTGIAVGLWPAIRMSRVDPATDLRGLGRSSGASQSVAIRRALVAAEVAISLVLAVATALFVQSLRRVQQIDPGFTTGHALSMRVSLPRERYADRASVVAFQQRLEAGLRALPGVQSVGGTNIIPLSGASATVDAVVDGRAFRQDEVPEAEYRVVSPDYFDAMGIRLLGGRMFTARDRAPSPDVAVINKTLADRMWPGQPAIGGHLRIEPGDRLLDHVVEVVGIVADVKQFGLDGRATMDLYVPFAQMPESNVVWIRNSQFWVIRAAGDPLALAGAARAALTAADPDVPASSVRSLEQAIDGTLAVRRFNAWIVALFGYAALMLTACGIYAVSAQAVSARSRELGIRAALGASPQGLVKMVLRTDFAAVAGGIVVGLIAARAVASAVAGLLFEITPGDPAPYALVAIVLAAVGALSCYVPASRAANSDPLWVLRND
jgi:predicted permease